MHRESFLHKDQVSLFERIRELNLTLDVGFRKKYQRSLPLNEQFVGRWERANRLGFGEGSSIYDSSLVIGQPVVGKCCWIGPWTILDASGGLTIGDNCTISAGVHIYTHDNIKSTLTSGRIGIERKAVRIESNVYIAPNSIVTKGVCIGHCSVIAAYTLVKDDVPPYSIVAGQPGKAIGEVKVKGSNVEFVYDK
ncbi:MAG: acyltransferase [Methanobacteriota archaeon]|nr:MAG: acyltransferase [Euryarchaeota archaeon]